MVRKIDHKKMGRSALGWLTSWFHFSFAEYYNPDNIQFGALRVINDDLIAPHTGFDTHPHKNMEIVTYVVSGQLTHEDSMHNRRTLDRGDIQYMSAGTGVLHSEFNLADIPLRLLQIWIIPDKPGYTPRYGDHRFPWEDRQNRWMPLVSNEMGDAPVKVHQDMQIFVTDLSLGKSLPIAACPGRQAYLVVMEGSARLGDIILSERDAAEITSEYLSVTAVDRTHMLLFEMAEANG